MTKDAKGMWTVTVGPLRPELYNYSFSVDGTRISDPQNQHTARGASWFVVPGTVAADFPSTNYQLNEVPHGSVSQVWYSAPSLGLTRRMTVYTPPGYEAGTNRYPVLYLLHGGNQDELAWTGIGRTAEILDNLIAQHRAVPMIVVMPNGYDNLSLSNIDALAPKPIDSGSGVVILDNPDIPDSLAKDVVPYIDRNFRTKLGPQNRAVAGLSRGGAQALIAALYHPDTFSAAGLFSPAVTHYHDVIDIPTPADAAMRRGPEVGHSIDGAKFAAALPMLGPQLNNKVHIFWAIGQVDGGLLESSHVAKKILDEKGVKYTWVERPDYGHEWSFWRLELQEFASQIFKATNSH